MTSAVLARIWDPKLTQRGVALKEYVPQAGQAYWRLVKANFMDVLQAGGRHHIFVDTLDEHGDRQVGVPVRFFNGGSVEKLTEAKPGEPSATNYDLYAAGWGYSTEIVGGASDTVSRMGLGDIATPMQGDHVSYMLVFQRVTAGQTLPVPPVIPPPVVTLPAPTDRVSNVYVQQPGETVWIHTHDRDFTVKVTSE